MKRLLPLVLTAFSLFFILIADNAFSQSYLGMSSGNYSGITGVSLQPASIADSRLKWDLNLFSIDVNYNNNFFYVKKDAILENKFFKSPYNSDFDAVKRDLLEIGTENNKPVYVRMNSTVQLPSVMITTGEKSAIALNLRSRTFMQIDNMSPELARMIYEDFQYEPYMGESFNMSNVRTDIVSWLEAGFTYARVLYNDGQNFFKFGITGKYLGGVASGYMNSDQINFAFNSDSTVSVNSDNVNYGHSSKFDLDFANRKNYNPESSAFSYDVGLVYEYRGNIDAVSFWKYNEEGDPELAARRDKNKYLFKIGVSYLNGGRLDFTKPSDVNDFSVNVNNYDYGNVHAHNIAEVDSAIASVVNLKDGGRDYTVALPQVFSAQIDLKLVKGLYLNMLGYFPLDNADAKSSIQAVRTFAITPRWENRWFGIYVPLSFNEFHDTHLGAAVRLGPLFVGSSNLASVLFEDKLKAADFHLGLKIPVGFGKPSKAMRAFKRITERRSALGTQQEVLSERTQNIFALQEANDSLKNEIDQLKQKIEALKESPAYRPPHIPITININNYAGETKGRISGKNRHKTIEIDSAYRQNKYRQQDGFPYEKGNGNNNPKNERYDYRDQQPDTLNYNFDTGNAAPVPSDSLNYYSPDTTDYSSDATLYERMQQQNKGLKEELQQLRNQLRQQQVDSQKNSVMKQQLDTLMQMINEQNAKIRSIEDSIEKKK